MVWVVSTILRDDKEYNKYSNIRSIVLRCTESKDYRTSATVNDLSELVRNGFSWAHPIWPRKVPKK